MTCQELYRITLSLIGEEDACGDCADLEKRFLPLLNAFCAEAGGQETVCAEGLDEPFPLGERFVCPCAFFAAAMLVSDENEAQSALLSAQCERMMESIRRSTAAVVEPIVNRYR
ncbi:MAG: hypothetical protein E7655_05550 [Ruminococcaceae bacterium]|nr:hypothetical protein [Oscillospiraceae bacterium]